MAVLPTSFASSFAPVKNSINIFLFCLILLTFFCFWDSSKLPPQNINYIINQTWTLIYFFVALTSLGSNHRTPSILCAAVWRRTWEYTASSKLKVKHTWKAHRVQTKVWACCLCRVHCTTLQLCLVKTSPQTSVRSVQFNSTFLFRILFLFFFRSQINTGTLMTQTGAFHTKLFRSSLRYVLL